jgi:hypothetical protein
MIASFVGLHGRLEGIIARLLGAVRGTQPQMKMTGTAEFVICDYAIIVTFRVSIPGASYCRGRAKRCTPVCGLNHGK